MTGPELKALGAAIFGFGTGLYWFFKGFKVFREYRVIKDTPEIPIRSISMGLVHVHGKAGGEETVTSPISDTPCLYYQIVVEKWITGARGGGSWTDYRTDSKGVRFNLEDASGKTAVDLQGAEVKLVPTSVTETQRTQAPPVGLSGEGLDPRLSLAMYEIVRSGGFSTGGFNFDAKLRRQSLARADLFHGHIGGIDTLARALLVAADMVQDDALYRYRANRYEGWSGDLGQSILSGQTSLSDLAQRVEAENIDPRPVSGGQELLENLVNQRIWATARR